MPATVTISFGDLDNWLRQLSTRITTADFAPAWKRVGVLLAAGMKKNFAGQHAPDKTPWQPIKQYRARGAVGKLRQGQILRDRGLLMASATGRGPNHMEKSSPQAFEWGTNLHYAHIHQEGGVIRPRHGRALAIPLTREAYRAGSPRNFPRPLNVVWPRGRTGGWLVEAKTGARGRSIMHYKLAAKVTIPARPFLGMNQDLIDETVLILLEHLRRLLRQ